MSQKLLPYLTVLIFLLTVGVQSCSDRPPSQLSRRDRVDVDTLFTRQVKELRAETDSLCELLIDSKLQSMVDSLLEIRRKEIVRLRQRVRNN